MDKAQAGTGDNHAISALKFKIIREFLELGWNVLLSDVDIVVVQVRAEILCCCLNQCRLCTSLHCAVSPRAYLVTALRC